MENRFSEILKGKVVIIGIGNILRADDGVGPLLVQQLRGKINAVCFDAGTAPENYTGKIIKEAPDTILLVDALHLGREGGEYEVLTKEEILNSGLTTHDISPKMLIEYLEKETGANIYMLGIQPESVAFGKPMSGAVKAALNLLVKNLSK